MEGLAIDLEILQNGLFPRAISLETVLGPQLQYGVYLANHLQKGRMAANGFIAYDPQRLARGIRVYWVPQEKKKISLHVTLPTAGEEIDDLFLMAERVCSAWSGASVRLGPKEIASSMLEQARDQLKVLNLRSLHEAASNVLDGSHGNLIIGCALHRLVIGPKEADRFWSGTDTDAFRDWLHERQSIDAYVAEPEILEHKEDAMIKLGMYTLLADHASIFPRTPEVPIRYYSRSTGKPLFRVSSYRVRFLSADGSRTLGYLSFPEFMDGLSDGCTEYYDADDVLIHPLSDQQLEAMILKASGRNADSATA